VQLFVMSFGLFVDVNHCHAEPTVIDLILVHLYLPIVYLRASKDKGEDLRPSKAEHLRESQPGDSRGVKELSEEGRRASMDGNTVSWGYVPSGSGSLNLPVHVILP
jgi:hypothetical protein